MFTIKTNDLMGQTTFAADINKENIEKDFFKGFKKIQKELLSCCDQNNMVRNRLMVKGRDQLIYRPFSMRKNLYYLLLTWKRRNWSIAQTSGLLADISLKLKRNLQIRGDYFVDTEDLSEHGAAKRKNIVKNSAWARDSIPKGEAIQMGPSSTTVHVLRLILSLDCCLDKEVESIIYGLIYFWGLRRKRITGKYHTPVEVFATYNKYLIETKYNVSK